MSQKQNDAGDYATDTPNYLDSQHSQSSEPPNGTDKSSTAERIVVQVPVSCAQKTSAIVAQKGHTDIAPDQEGLQLMEVA